MGSRAGHSGLNRLRAWSSPIAGLVMFSCLLLLLMPISSALWSEMLFINGEFNTGEWEDGWDKSSLTFDGQAVGCTLGDVGAIWADVQNGPDAEDMQGSSTFQLWYAESGNPKDGSPIFTGGVIPPIANGEVARLEVTTADVELLPGNYKFRAFQRERHPGSGDLWSETIAFTNHCEIIVDTLESTLPPEATEEPVPDDETLQEQDGGDGLQEETPPPVPIIDGVTVFTSEDEPPEATLVIEGRLGDSCNVISHFAQTRNDTTIEVEVVFTHQADLGTPCVQEELPFWTDLTLDGEYPPGDYVVMVNGTAYALTVEAPQDKPEPDEPIDTPAPPEEATEEPGDEPTPEPTEEVTPEPEPTEESTPESEPTDEPTPEPESTEEPTPEPEPTEEPST